MRLTYTNYYNTVTEVSFVYNIILYPDQMYVHHVHALVQLSSKHVSVALLPYPQNQGGSMTRVELVLNVNWLGFVH